MSPRRTTTTRPGRHRRRWRSRRTAWVCGVVLGVALTATPAAAFWSATSTAGSSGGSSAASLPRGAVPTVALTTPNDASLSWSATTLSDGTAATGYVVRRTPVGGGVAQAATGGCSGVVSTRTCTELDVPDGSWTYTVTPRYAAWSGQESLPSSAVLSDATPPTTTLTRTVVSGASVMGPASGAAATVYYRGAAAGSLRLVNALSDAGSGPARSTTGALSGTTTGWTHSPSSVTTPTGGPYTSNTFSWTAGTTSEPSVGVTGADVYGNTTATSVALRVDNTGPTGGAVDYPNGFVSPAGSATTTQIEVTTEAAADARAGVVSRTLEVSDTTLSGRTCGTSYTAWRTEVTSPPDTHTATVTLGRCYRYRHVLTDALGNVTTVTSASLTRVRSYRSVVVGTSNLIGYWRLGDSGAVVDAEVGTDGAYGPGNTAHLPTRGAVGALAGDPDTAALFDGVDDWARLNRTVSTTFSIEFWFRSDQNPTYSSGTQWYDGAGMVDADLPGVANDFGVSLTTGGRVAAGTGNPDRTVRSGTGLNNDAWHHVVMTRGSGVVRLYVDGVSQGTVATTSSALTASTYLNLGRLQTGTNHFRGHLDEVAVYSVVLSQTNVTAHYQAGLP